MTIEEQVALINGDYNSKALGIFPFISKTRITILKSGYYKKQKSNYRGLGVVFDKFSNKTKVILLGYYFVDKNYILVPEGLEISKNKKTLIDSYLAKGFELKQGKSPSLKPIEFPEDSTEYKLAIQRNNNYNKNDSFSNKS